MKSKRKKHLEKFHKESEHHYYSVPKEIIERIHAVIQDEFEDHSEPPTKIDVYVHDSFNGNIIHVKVDGGAIEDSVNSPNYYGDSIAESLLSELPEIELVGFDVQYQVKLRFKLR